MPSKKNKEYISTHADISVFYFFHSGHKSDSEMVTYNPLSFFLLSYVIQTPTNKQEEEKEQDKASRTARVQPTPQTKDAAADSPNAPNADRRK